MSRGHIINSPFFSSPAKGFQDCNVTEIFFYSPRDPQLKSLVKNNPKSQINPDNPKMNFTNNMILQLDNLSALKKESPQNECPPDTDHNTTSAPGRASSTDSTGSTGSTDGTGSTGSKSPLKAKVKYSIDIFEINPQNNTLDIEGWAFLENAADQTGNTADQAGSTNHHVSAISPLNQKIKLNFRGSGSFSFICACKTRPDVAAYFQNQYLQYCGYRCQIPLETLKNAFAGSGQGNALFMSLIVETYSPENHLFFMGRAIDVKKVTP
jgi:hypothetical protein